MGGRCSCIHRLFQMRGKKVIGWKESFDEVLKSCLELSYQKRYFIEYCIKYSGRKSFYQGSVFLLFQKRLIKVCYRRVAQSNLENTLTLCYTIIARSRSGRISGKMKKEIREQKKDIPFGVSFFASSKTEKR